MSKIAITLLIIGAVAAFAGPPPVTSVVLVHATTRAEINRLMDLGYDVDTCRKPTPSGVEVYIEPELLTELEADGFTYEVLWADSRDRILPNVLYDGPLYDGTRNLDFDHYYTPDEANLALDNIHDQLPDVSEVYTIGYSVDERPINAIKITDNPGVEEVEPEVRIIGAHHGDEKISYMVVFYFLQKLADNYNNPPSNDWTRLVNGTELWAVPMMNPDGVYYNQRYNSHSVDLNRNYSYMWVSDPYGHHGTEPFSEPETCAIRDLSLDNTFVISHSHHSGAQYINYIWNYVTMGPPDYVTPPNHDFIMELSYLYQDDCGYTITNGGDWYTTNGDCNDWSMGERGDLDDTIEISYTKTPPPGQIIYYSQLNDDAQLQTLLMPLDYGFQGVVTDAETDEPLDAEVYCNNEEIDWFAFTDPAKGDYYWPVMPGTYSITASAEGYPSVDIDGIVVNEGEVTIVNIEMGESQTDVTVQEFRAVSDGPNVVLTWSAYEKNNAGWNLYRYMETEGLKRALPELVNRDLITGKSPYRYIDNNISAGKWRYRLEAVDVGGASAFVAETAIDHDPGARPYVFALAQNAPNPAGGGTAFVFSVPETTRAELSVYDLAGRRVATVFNGEAEAGENRVDFDATTLSPGVYLYRLTAGGETAVKKLVVAR
jgi:hypothetical protein